MKAGEPHNDLSASKGAKEEQHMTEPSSSLTRASQQSTFAPSIGARGIGSLRPSATVQKSILDYLQPSVKPAQSQRVSKPPIGPGSASIAPRRATLHCSAPALDPDLQKGVLESINKRRSASGLPPSSRIFSMPTAKLIPVQECQEAKQVKRNGIAGPTFTSSQASSASASDHVEQQIAPGLLSLHSRDALTSNILHAADSSLGVDCNMQRHPKLLHLEAKGTSASAPPKPKSSAQSASRPNSKRPRTTRRVRGVSPMEHAVDKCLQEPRLIMGSIKLSAGATRPPNLPLCFSTDCDSD
ncbi:hypothetical protein IE81DRAFT_347782 [Ceraceosorus guamensis]|uniref:Uncharacterized protein n=1 Tax=Ceraceosorus guamensis TaxID=1522189 RepID=A0A316VYS5_9BASI|nr:hypothetical protein IE81DRAFT_347782 [Ceraceosorus guamensis]PWN42058.1 hypothetical protein IE81DRAFT_347782 [Ceraceosorus guamensis]